MDYTGGTQTSSSEHSVSLSFVVVFSVVLFMAIALGVLSIMHCYCGRDNEYTEIIDQPITPDIESGECSEAEEATPAKPDSDPADIQKAPIFMKKTVPTPVGEQSSADILAQEIDYFVRHMENFYATGFYCSIVVLENHISFAEKWKSKSLREFLRRRPEFKVRSNTSAFKLTSLTPFREADVQVSGQFQCVNVNCRNRWKSLCSYADHFQKCKSCRAHVYPFEQTPLTAAEINDYLRNPVDENFLDPSDIAYALKRDAVDILAHTHSPVRPTRSALNRSERSPSY